MPISSYLNIAKMTVVKDTKTTVIFLDIKIFENIKYL